MNKIVFSVAVLLVFAGCSPSGYVINSGNQSLTKPFVESIKKGKTTKQEILSSLGQPQFKTQNAVFGEMWTYSRYQEKHYAKDFFSGDTVSGWSVSVCITFDGDVVKDVTTAESSPFQTVTLEQLPK